MALAEDYVAALMAVSLVFRSYEEACGQSPVLVGGAATAIYTGGLFPSGDFDIVAGRDDAFDAAMLKHGFVPEDRLGKLKIGYYHPDHPTFGFQQVSGPLFDGLSDADRLCRVLVSDLDDFVVLPAIEDLIADRLGQHAVASPTDPSRLLQAKALLQLAETIDLPYVIRRVGDEQGDFALLGIPSDTANGT